MAQLPDWLQALNAQGGQAYTDPSGMQYVPLQTNGANGPVNGYASIAANTPNLGGFGQHDFSTYDGQGNAAGSKQLGYTDDWFTKYMPYIMAAVAGGGVAGLYGGAAGGAGAGAGAGVGAAGGAGEGLATGGFLGEAPFELTGGGALDFGAAGAGAGGAGLGGSGATVGGPMSVGGANGTALSTLGAAPATTGGGSLLSGIGGGDALKLGGSLLAGLAAGKAPSTNSTTARDIPEWLKPSVFGMIDQTNALRNKQMAPGYMQGYDDMRNVGQGLLDAPIAGNGVGRVPYPSTFASKR